jgi:teichuronic acid exporter
MLSAGVKTNFPNSFSGSLRWSTMDLIARAVLGLVILMGLTRLVSPQDFGVFALLHLFIGLALILVDGGLSSALIQHQDISHTDESSVFWINLINSLCLGAILCWSASTLAEFYSQAQLKPLIWMLAVHIFFVALGTTHATLLSKQLAFRAQFYAGVVSTLIAGTIALGLAWYNYGVWALAIQLVVASAVNTSILWMCSTWRPAWVLSVPSLKRLSGFGSYIMVAAIIDVVYTRIYTLLIGKFFSIRDLAFFDRAENSKQLILNLVGSILSRVLFPVFSECVSDPQQLRNQMRAAVKLSMLIHLPLMLGMAFCARNLVLVMFGEDWLPSASYLQVLCLAGIFWPLHVINLIALKAQGHAALFLRLELIKKTVGVVLLAISCAYGLTAIAWSFVAASFLAFLINTFYSGRFLAYGCKEQTIDLLPTLAMSCSMVLLLMWVTPIEGMHQALELALQVVIGFVFVLIWCWLFRLSAFLALVRLMRTHQVQSTP